MLSGVVEFPRRALGEAMASGRVWAGLKYLRQLRARRYDLVVDAQGLLRSGIFAWATGAPRRVGFAEAREGGWLGLTERHAISPSAHAVDRMIGLIEAMGVPPVRDMRLYTAAEDRAWVRNDFRMTAGRFAVVAPTSRWAGKRWPIEGFVDVTRRLLDRGLCVAIVGSRAERDQCVPLIELATREPRLIDLVGATSVARLMAVIEASAVVVACDSAALHMAIGFDRPAVALYGPTRLDLVGPYIGSREPAASSRTVTLQHVERGDVFDHKDDEAGAAMMARITVDEVAAAVESVLQAG
jgi:ADP-heptose:LPS heptosyltransferase